MSLQQLRANMREMEKLCARVRAQDAPALQNLVQPIRDRASAAVQDFLLLHSSCPVPQTGPPPPPSTSQSSSSSDCLSSSYHGDEAAGGEPASVCQTQLRLPQIPPDQSAAESWDSLEEVRLSGLYCLF